MKKRCTDCFLIRRWMLRLDQACNINILYLRASSIPWQDARWTRRLPVLVFELAGITARAALPASVSMDRRRRTRFRTGGGRPLGRISGLQLRQSSQNTNLVEVVFAPISWRMSIACFLFISAVRAIHPRHARPT